MPYPTLRGRRTLQLSDPRVVLMGGDELSQRNVGILLTAERMAPRLTSMKDVPRDLEAISSHREPLGALANQRVRKTKSRSLGSD